MLLAFHEGAGHATVIDGVLEEVFRAQVATLKFPGSEDCRKLQAVTASGVRTSCGEGDVSVIFAS